MTEAKEDIFRTSISVSERLQAQALARFLSGGGTVKAGFNGAAVEALELYANIGKPQPFTLDEQGIAEQFLQWLRTCHKNPADYLAAEFACRRALGIAQADWEDFQKGLRK